MTNAIPRFGGETSDAEDPVKVRIYNGQGVVGEPALSVEALPPFTGSWSVRVGTGSSLAGGTYTAVAEQTEPPLEAGGLGQTSETPPVVFTVDTEPPAVTLEAPALVSNDRTPSFSGTASESAPVTVKLYKGAMAGGTPIRELVAPVVGGHWTSAHVSPALEAGSQYTALASESSSLGNKAGESKPATFEVDTEAPTVTLTPPPSPSNDTTPSFAGTVAGPDSEAKPVTMYVYEGATPFGRIVRTLTAAVVHESWQSGSVTPPLTGGKREYTAVASTPSAIGNATGESAPATFVVDTEPPTVTLKQLATRSSDATPSFVGTASEATTVTVSVYEGPQAEGLPVATVSADGTAGTWESAAVSPSLPDGQYTAVATQISAIGNGAGSSSPVSFTIDTKPPVVTLRAVPTPSPNRAPSFSGTAEDHTPVTVEIYNGATAGGAIVASGTAEGDGGEWATGRLEELLGWGEYTAVATQPSSIGNPDGKSAPFTFAVAQIHPAVETEAASSVTRTSAALYASVNPSGGPVSACYFEFGPTSSYGSRVECGFATEITAFPPAATGAVAVFARIYGLQPSTTYHARIVAVGEGGTGVGADLTFTTQEPLLFPAAVTAVAPSAVAPRKAAGGVAALFAAQLLPRGHAAGIGALLRHGLFKQRFKAPEAGTAVIKWLYLPPGAKPGKKGARPPALIASGKVIFPAAGTATVEIRLTAAGRRLLQQSRRIRLTATCAFTPVAGAAVATSGAFLLHR